MIEYVLAANQEMQQLPYVEWYGKVLVNRGSICIE